MFSTHGPLVLAQRTWVVLRTLAFASGKTDPVVFTRRHANSLTWWHLGKFRIAYYPTIIWAEHIELIHAWNEGITVGAKHLTTARSVAFELHIWRQCILRAFAVSSQLLCRTAIKVAFDSKDFNYCRSIWKILIKFIYPPPIPNMLRALFISPLNENKFIYKVFPFQGY